MDKEKSLKPGTSSKYEETVITLERHEEMVTALEDTFT